MKGIVDDDLRAPIDVLIGSEPNGEKSSVLVWVDTAFNGGLVLPRQEIDNLGLKEYSSTPAILADGQQVELPTFTCYVDWFGKEYRTQIVANECPSVARHDVAEWSRLECQLQTQNG